MNLRRLAGGVLSAVVVVSACSTESPTPSDLPDAVVGAADGESIGLRTLFGDDWFVAYVDFCPGDSLAVQNRVVDVSFVPCVDPDFGLANVVLFGESGQIVRWYEGALPASVLFGCFTPDATWTRTPNGFSFNAGTTNAEPCMPIRDH